MLPAHLAAQTFANLHSFTPTPVTPPYVNGDGANPHAGLVLSGSILYGTARVGGLWGNGTIYRVNTDGTGFTNLHSFTAMTLDSDTNSSAYTFHTNSDGMHPLGTLVLSAGTLYGTTVGGGSSSRGTVFKINADGSGFTSLYSFSVTPPYPGPYTNADGAYPVAGLIVAGKRLYGTTYYGGSYGNGTVFRMNTDGKAFANLHSFNNPDLDGANPVGSLVLASNRLYGTTFGYGSTNYGTVFAMNTDGTGFTNLHNFSGNDGSFPKAGLILQGNTLYGTTAGGGDSLRGTVFAVNTDGTGFTTLHNFIVDAFYTNTDGFAPSAALILSGNMLYGTAVGGGAGNSGTVFEINTDGTNFKTLYTFSGGSDGAEPFGGVMLLGNMLYGTTDSSGDAGNGTAFSIFVQPQLTISPAGNNVILSWPTNSTGFTLQSATSLDPSAIWSTVSPQTVVVNGQNTVTNPVTGTRKFYRLSQ